MPVTTRHQRKHTDSLSSTTLVQDSTSPSLSSLSPTLPAQGHVEEQQQENESSDEESSSGDDDSDTSSSSSSDSDSEQEDEDDTAARLSALLLKAKQAARARAEEAAAARKGKRGGKNDDGLAGNDEVVLFGVDEDDEEEAEVSEREEETATPQASTSSSSRPTISLPPSLSRPLSLSLPTSSLSSRKLSSSSTSVTLAQDLQGALAASGGENVKVVGGGVKGKGKERELESTGDAWGKAPEPKLSKKELRARQPHTAGPQWFNLPATPVTPELKRELDALRLSNALDPKKFLRGGAKKEKVGEFFQIGHLLPSTTRVSSLSTSQRDGKVHKQSFIESLITDEHAKAYAKKKTAEVTRKGMSGRKRQRSFGGSKGGYDGGKGGKGKKQKL
ncbi:hypothetical protein JCM8547_008907 [Rhodosporidiobolus lusitaniae]